MVGHLDHVLGELLGIGEIVRFGVVPAGGIAALGQEPRRGIREHLDMVDVAGLQAVPEPPFLGHALTPIVMRVVGRIECFGHLVLVGLLGLHSVDRVGPVAGNRGALPHERIPVGHIGGVAAADVIPGHVQIQAVLAKNALVERLAQLLAVLKRLGIGFLADFITIRDESLFAVVAGGIGEPSQRCAPAVERTVRIPRVRGHHYGIIRYGGRGVGRARYGSPPPEHNGGGHEGRHFFVYVNHLQTCLLTTHCTPAPCRCLCTECERARQLRATTLFLRSLSTIDKTDASLGKPIVSSHNT